MTTGDVGNLRVRLSLDNAQFERSIASMNRTLQAMGQEIRGLQNRGREWGSSIDGLRQKQEAYSRLLEGQQTKVRRLAEEHEKAKQRYGENSEQAERLAVQLNRASAEMDRTQRELNETTAELQRLERELAQSQTVWGRFGAAATAAGEKLKAVGDKMKSIGQDLSMKVTTPLVGVGALAAKVGSDFEAGMSKVAAISGATGGDLAALEAKAREMGATTQFSASEAADALSYMAMAGWKTNDMLAGAGGIMNLAAASGENLAMVSDIVTDALTAFGMGANDTGKFVDILAAASSNSNTNVAMLGESFKYAAPVVGALKMNADDAALALGLMANAGIKGSNSGTALRTMLTNLASPTKEMDKAMNSLGISLTDSDGKMKTLRQVMDDLRGSFGKLEPAQQAAYAATIFGKEAMSGALAIINASDADYQKLASSIDNSAGSAENMAKVMNDNLQGRLKEMKSALEEAAISVYKAMQPALESLVATIQKLADWFNTLSPEVMRTIVVIGGIVAAIGPVLVIVGTLVSSLGTVFGAFGTVSSAIAVATTGATAATPAIGALASVFTALTGPIGIAVAAIAAIGIGTVVVAKEMSKSSIAVEDWSNKVSEGTAKAVGSYLDLENQATTSLNQLAWSGETVTQEMANKMIGIYDQMGQQVLAEMQSDHAAQLQATTDFYASSSVLSETEEAEILAKMKEKQAEKEQATIEGNARIKEIWETASKEKRGITKVEQEEINKINATMKENAIKYLSESERDQKLILENLKTESSKITAEQAAEVVKNSEKQRKETVKEAENQFNETKRNLQMQRDELGIISKEQYEKLVADAEKTRDETIKNAEDMHSKVVTEAKAQAGEHVEQVNWETGEVLSKWEMFKKNSSKKWSEIKTNASKKWDEIKTDTISKWEEIKAWPGKKIDEMKSSVEKKMAEVKTKIETKWKEAEAFLSNINLVNIGKDIVSGLIKGIGEMGEGVKRKVEDLANKIPAWAKKILGIRSPSRVFAQIGQWISEGWAIGIEEKGSMVKNAVSDIALTAKDIAEHYVNEEKKLRSGANTEIAKIEKNKAAEIAKIEKRMHEDVAKAQRAAASKKKKTTQDDALKIQRIREDVAAKILKLETSSEEKIKNLKSKSTKEIVELETKMNKDLLEETKRYIDDKKSLDQLSLIEEAQIWEQSMKLFAEGTKERVKAQQEYKKATEAVSKEITAINTDFQNQIQKINDDLVKQEETLTKAYEDAVDKRASSLVSFKSLFDAFKVEIDVTGEQLIANLHSQVDGFKLWQSEIEKISGRAIDKGLIEELRQMGPNALPQLVALNQLTDSQLQQYSDLYKEKSKLARKQAETELKGMKDDTDKQIKALRDTANKQLTTLGNEWNEKIKSLTKSTSTELSSLEQIGKDAGNGLLQGLSSTASSIQKKAQEIADSVSKTISKALQIKSPSRVMKGFGVNIGEGLVIGMDDMLNKVTNAAGRLASSVEGSMSFTADTNSLNRATSVTTNNTNNTPINITLHYNGTGSERDAFNIVDIVEKELGSRFKNNLRLQGSKG